MDEKTLVEQAQRGDRGSFELLVKLHFRAVYNMAFRFMGDHGGADEVVQETFVKAHRALEGFRQESSIKSWLLRIAVNTAKNALRSRDRRETVNIDDVSLGAEHAEFSRMEELQTAKLLKHAVGKLPPKQRRVLELRIWEDLSFKEIAEIVESPFDTAKANFRHAVMNLKKILEAADGGRAIEEVRMAFASLTSAEDEGYEP